MRTGEHVFNGRRSRAQVVEDVLPGEEWRVAHGYDGRYQVSSLGRVRSNPEARVRGSQPGRILFQGEDSKGYRQVYLWRQLKQTTVKVHRLVALAFIGDRPEGMTVNHINGNKANNTVANLEYVTNKENVRHAWRGARAPVVVRGEPMSLGEAVERFAIPGVGYTAVRKRVFHRGWDVEKALTTPLIQAGRRCG